MAIWQLKLETIQEHPADPTALNELISSLSQFGRFQFINCLLLCIPIICSAFSSISFVFTASGVEHRCNISQCDSHSSSYTEPWLNFTIPQDYGDWNRCVHYEAISGLEGDCAADQFNSSYTVGCENGYKFKDHENTISTEFEIFCSDQWKLFMVGTVSSIGFILGYPLGGYFSDRYGRKPVITACGVLSAIFGLAQSNAPEYYSFLCLEFLNMILCSTLYPTAILMAMELVNPNHRVSAVMLLTLTNSLAGAALGYLAGYLLDWRVLLRVIYTPGLLHIMLVCCLPESIRWLLSQSKEEDAIDILRSMARVNQRPLCEDKIRELKRRNRLLVEQSETIHGHYSIQQIFDALGLRISLCCFLWFSLELINMGLVLNLKGLSGNKFNNNGLTIFMNLPGSVIAALLMNRIGRRRVMSFSLVCCSTLLIALVICDVVLNYPQFSWYLYILAKMSSACCIITLCFLTTEIFPTNCRNSLFSLTGIFEGFGFMLSTQTPHLSDYYKYMPHLLFATLAFFNSGLVLFFPETANKVLPTTLEEARVLDRNMSIKQPNIVKAAV